MAEDQSTRWILWSREAAGMGSPAVAFTPPRADAGQQAQQAQQAQPAPVGPAPRGAPADETQHGNIAHRPGSRTLSSADHQLIEQIVKERLITSEFQPIRDLKRNQVVGFEALSRGPKGPLRAPDRMFAAATAAGLVGQLDWVCRATAFRTMLERDLPPAISLFVNVEPDSLIEPCPEDLLETIWQATARLRVFIDVTGRALTRYPTEVLETVRRARAAGWGVAVADVEFSASGLALLPALEPDVLKMNHEALTIGAGTACTAVGAALAEVEETGAALLLQRVEDETGAALGRSIGATYQAGRLHGAPAPLPPNLSVPMMPIPLRDAKQSTPDTPWDVLANNGAHLALGAHHNGVSYLLRTFASEAATVFLPPVIAVVLPDNGMTLQQESKVVYQMLLNRCPLALIAGWDVHSLNDWHVRAADLPAGHPLLDQFCFAALSPTLAIVLVARIDVRRPGVVDIAVSHQAATCRQVMRNIIDVMDTLEGGVRHTMGH